MSGEPVLLADFVFAALSADINNSVTTIAVDDASQFPNTAELGRAPLMATIESALTHPPTFEIVKVTAVSSNNLTVERAQMGTLAASHASGTPIKGTLSAEMVRRTRAGFSGDNDPIVDGIYRPGDRSMYAARQWRFHGCATFSIDDFTGARSIGVLGLDELPPAWLITDQTTNFTNARLVWRTLSGTIGTPAVGDSRSFQAAIIKAVDSTSHEALALLDIGLSDDMQAFVGSMTTGGDNTVNAGWVFAMDAAGKNGYYLSLVPGSSPVLYRLVDGTATSLGTVGTSVINNADLCSVTVYVWDDKVHIWYANAALQTHGHFDQLIVDRDTDPIGSNIGIRGVSASCATDTDLLWTQLANFNPVGKGIPRNINTNAAFTHFDADGTTVLDVSGSVDPTDHVAGSTPWDKGVGVFGVHTVTGAGSSATDLQYARYESGAVSNSNFDDFASLLSDFGASEVEFTLTLRDSTNATNVWGLLLCADDDGQNGILWYYFPQYGVSSFYEWKDGDIRANTDVFGTGNFSLQPDSDNLLRITVAISAGQITVYDANGTNSNHYSYSRQVAATSHIPPGIPLGTCHGLIYLGSDALADDTFGLVNATIGSRDYVTGWRQEPTVTNTPGVPKSVGPLGSFHFDESSSALFFSDGFQWFPASVMFGSGAPSNYASPVPGQVYVDIANAVLYMCNQGDWVSLAPISSGAPTTSSLVLRGFLKTLLDNTYPSPDISTVLAGDLLVVDGTIMEAATVASTVVISSPFDYSYNPPAAFPPPYNGTSDATWLPVGDAVIDTATSDAGGVQLTAGTAGSAGLVMTPHGAVFDELHVSFTADCPDSGSGFSVGMATPDSDVISIVNTAPTYSAWNGPTGLGDSAIDLGSTGFDKFSLIFPHDDTSAVNANGSEVLDSTQSAAVVVSPGTHDWDIRFELDQKNMPGYYQISIYRDGAQIIGSWYVHSRSIGGYLYFSGLDSSSPTGPVHLTDMKFKSVTRYQPLHVVRHPEVKVPLVLTNGWVKAGTVEPYWQIVGDRIMLGGSITGGTGGFCDSLEALMYPQGPDDQYVIGTKHSGSSYTPEPIKIDGSGTGYYTTTATSSDTVFLDGVSFARSLT